VTRTREYTIATSGTLSNMPADDAGTSALMHTLIGASSTCRLTASTSHGVDDGRSAAQFLTSVGEDAGLVEVPQRRVGEQSTLAQMRWRAFEPLHSQARPTSAPITFPEPYVFADHE
jgi:hypothetical protein